MTIEQIIVLAVMQGITEFLPISSSGHLILVPALTGWPDQGLVHRRHGAYGLARRDSRLFLARRGRHREGALLLLKGEVTPEGKLAIYIVLAPSRRSSSARSQEAGHARPRAQRAVVAWNTIFYGSSC